MVVGVRAAQLNHAAHYETDASESVGANRKASQVVRGELAKNGMAGRAIVNRCQIDRDADFRLCFSAWSLSRLPFLL